MTTIHENATGKYFLTRYSVTRVYQVCEKRMLGSGVAKYLLSTGSSIKGDFSTLEAACLEAFRRQSFLDMKAGD